MLDKKTFTEVYRKYGALARAVMANEGLTEDADIDEASQDLWTQLWKNRDAWPNPTNVRGYIKVCAKHAVYQHTRKDKAKKRAGFHVPLEEDRSSVANIKLSKPAEAEKFAERTSLATFIRILAARLGGEHEAALLARLKAGDTSFGEEESAARRVFDAAIKAARRYLALPVKDPQNAGVDPLSHLARVLRAKLPEPSKA